MRVISGKYKGKKLLGFDISGTRPTMDRIKESLFASIQNKIKNSICLDLFAGSGSLGLEALSNGADECTFVDNSIEALKVLKSNLQNIPNAIIIADDYKKFLSKNSKKYDIIFLDPPYQLNLITKTIEIIINNDLINDFGIIVCEYESEEIKTDLEIIINKKYGNKKVTVFEKK